MFAGAGLLDGEPATTHWSAQQALGLLGAEPRREERVVWTGTIVAAAGVSAGIDPALWLVGEMFGREAAEAIQLDIEYDPRPPFDAGHVSKASGAVKRKALADMVRSAPEIRVGETFVSSLTGAQKTLWRSGIRRMRR